MKFDRAVVLYAKAGRAPYGARGLKFVAIATLLVSLGSRPIRGAWIEILPLQSPAPAERRSRPIRGAWIDIGMVAGIVQITQVAPHTGRVD